MTGKPDAWWGEPHIADPYWTPLWEAAEAEGVSISFHAGGGDPALGWQKLGYKGMPSRTRFTANSVPTFFGNAETIVDLIFGEVLERYPSLRFVIVESGIGWVSFLLECMDYQFIEHRIREVSPRLTLMPSEYFHRQMFATFWFEEMAPRYLLEQIGVGNVMFETDFPHPASLWPPQRAKEHMVSSLAGHPAEVRERILWRNAAELYRIDYPARKVA